MNAPSRNAIVLLTVVVLALISVTSWFFILGGYGKVCPSCPKCPPQPDKLHECPSNNVYPECMTKGAKDYIPPQYFQEFPLSRYPGMLCFVITSNKRHLVMTQNCNTINVNEANVTFGKYVLPRQSPNQTCNKCYASDYLNTLAFLLFGKPE